MSETEIQQVTAILTAKGHIAAAIYQIRLRISTAHWISNIYFRFCPCLCFLWPVTAFNVLAPDLVCGLLITHEWSWVGYFCRETARRPPEQCGKFMNNSSKGKGRSSYQSRPTCCRTLLLWMGVHADVASQTNKACVTVMVSGQQILSHHLCAMPTPGMFNSSPQPHGIHKPHAAQPDLHLLLLTDLRQCSIGPTVSLISQV